MCDICKNAYDELKPVLEKLQEQFPGTTVTEDGKTHNVAPNHHVLTALMVATEVEMAKEMKFMLEQKAAKQGLSVEDFLMFGGGKKEIAA